MKRTASRTARGFSTLQLVITIAVMAIVTSFAVVSISRARDHVRLMNSARQFAAYAERSRADAVRRHDDATISVVDNNTYTVRMDWGGFGNATDRNFDLERGITFTPGMVGRSVTFNWRGRIPAEESFGFTNGRNSVSVGITGSGDVTFDAQFFHDASLPPPTWNGTGGRVLPEPGQTPVPPPSGTPTPTPTPGSNPTPTPTPDLFPTPTPTPDQFPTPTPTPTPDQNPTPTPPPSPNPSPQICTLNAPDSVTIGSDGSTTVSANRTNITGTGTISATSSNSGQIQVSPSSHSVEGTAAASFTITIKKNSGSVTFSATGCTSKTVTITVN